MVGDYKWDMLCAKNAGAPCVVLMNGGDAPDWAREADFIITKLRDVIKIVEGLAPREGRCPNVGSRPAKPMRRTARSGRAGSAYAEVYPPSAAPEATRAAADKARPSKESGGR
jgi:hypothetical protein